MLEVFLDMVNTQTPVVSFAGVMQQALEVLTRLDMFSSGVAAFEIQYPTSLDAFDENIIEAFDLDGRRLSSRNNLAIFWPLFLLSISSLEMAIPKRSL